MTLGLAMIVKDGADTLRDVLRSARPLVDHWTVVDTGSTDGSQNIVRKELKGVPGSLVEHEWAGFADARNVALGYAGERSDWVLMLDDDMRVQAHPGTKAFVLSDPDPDVMAWEVEIVCGPRVHRLPFLTRSGVEWRYEGPCHEYLTPNDVKRRHLLGLALHHQEGPMSVDRQLEYIDLLADGVRNGDPRSVFYTARALDMLGRKEEAALLYEQRGRMGDWEEEAWYAEYSAAALRRDEGGLIDAYLRRPWRPEPLKRLLEITQGRRHDDLLFVENVQ
jgi:glycosyltransferase involved in cell wall biosynthesis